MTTSWKSQAPAALNLPTAAASKNPSVVPLHMTPLPESLLSPVDPEFLEGASSSARFGLDIGGTLCKVVFFEPITITSDSLETPKSRLSRMSFEGSESCNGVCSDHDHHPPQLSSDGAGVMADVSRRRKSSRQARKMWVSSHEPVHLPGRGTLYFKCFETWKMEEFLTLTKEHSLVTKGRALGATGGGARKFKDQFLEIADLQLQRADELTWYPIKISNRIRSGYLIANLRFVVKKITVRLRSLVRGIDFLARHAHHDRFEYPLGSYQGGVIQRPLNENRNDDGDISHTTSPNTSEPSRDSLDSKGKQPKANTFQGPVLAPSGTGWLGGSEDLYPYLVVNIGSGVSILRVDDADKFERVGGTSLGGSTFLGLASALTGCTSFEEAINYAMEGDSTQIDMLVGDIYGGDYTEMGLAATTVASSFGKLVQPGRREAAMQSPQHLAKAVLLMVTNNIGSIAMLHAQAAGVRHVMFTGSFLHENKLAMRLLAVAMEFWSKGNIKAVFLRHEGHVGAMGALLNTLDPINHIDSLLLNTS